LTDASRLARFPRRFRCANGTAIPTTPSQLEVAATEPGVAGNAAAGNVTKKATVETGTLVDVPLFIRVGDTIKVDTRTHEYLERAERVDN
jgi:hypothetical protein